MVVEQHYINKYKLDTFIHIISYITKLVVIVLYTSTAFYLVKMKG